MMNGAAVVFGTLKVEAEIWLCMEHDNKHRSGPFVWLPRDKSIEIFSLSAILFTCLLPSLIVSFSRSACRLARALQPLYGDNFIEHRDESHTEF